MITKNFINNKLIKGLCESNRDFLKWKRKNVTLRGIKELGSDNNVYGSFGKGLYTAFLGNRTMAKEYGTVYYVVNAIPKHPKVVNTLNDAEIFRYKLINNFCQSKGQKYSLSFLEKNSSIEEEMLKLGYDGLVIKGREMVNYTPENVKYFQTEYELEQYYYSLNNEID